MNETPIQQISRRLLERFARDARVATSTDLLTWSRMYLSEHFTQPPSRMHRWLASELDQLDAHRGRKINLIGPRGHAKSTIATLAYALQRAAENAERYIWLVSDTAHQAATHLENVKQELTSNTHLANDYPHICGRGSKWTSGSIRLNNDVVIEAYGTGQRIRGKRSGAHRPSLIM